METSEFGKRLRELRKRASLTQRELANKIGINFTYLSKIESGAMPPPSKKVLFRLADALNIDREELLILAGKIPSDVAQMLKNVENIKRLRTIGKQREFKIPIYKWGETIMKNLLNFRSLARVALGLTLVVTVGTLLWFASPAPIVRAIDFTFTPSQPSGYTGSSVSFSVKIDITNADLLPINSVDLIIGDSSTAYVDSYQDLPLPSSPNTTTATTSNTGSSSTISVSATSGAGWGEATMGSGTRTGYGYGYSESTGWLGWNDHTFSGLTGYGYGYYGTPWLGSTYVTYNITWNVPSGWPAGTYDVQLKVKGDNTKSIVGIASLTLSTEPVPVPVPEEPGVTDVSDSIDEEGVFTEEVIVESEDGSVSITIDEGITGLTEEGEPISEISIVEMAEEDIPPPPAEGNVIGITYNLGPNGATFSSPITLTFPYNPDNLPDGVNEEDLVVAIWDEDAGEWVELPGVVDTVNNTITATVDHFTAFAVIAPPVEEEEVIIPPVEEEEEEEEEVVAPPVEEEEEVVTPVVKAGLAWWIWLIIGLGSAAVIALLVYLLWYRPRRRPEGYSRTD